MVREIDLSRITVRLVEKVDKKGEGDDDHVISKLSGDLLPVLQQCLVIQAVPVRHIQANRLVVHGKRAFFRIGRKREQD